VAPQGKRRLAQFLAVLTDEQGGAGLSQRMILLISDARAQWAELDRRITDFDAEFVCWAKENEEARRRTTIPGIGTIVASALVAAVGRAETSSAAVISPHGLVWFRGSSPPAAGRSWSGSASAATSICAGN
jgi:transposase